MEKYDIIVVGAGHAGVEAALAASRMGCRCLLLSMSADQIATMSCNPAVGGLGKSQLAKELDVLGGQMARMADQSAMQYRLLNEKKGAAVRATRVHVDRHEYRQRMKFFVESQEGLSLKQAQVQKLILDGSKLIGIETSLGQRFYSEAVVLTTGTFMNGKAHVGRIQFTTGRAGEPASVGLSDFLRSIGLKLGRFKTGTVPRVDARSIDWSKTEEQASERDLSPLSVFTKEIRSDLESAHITYTNPRTHEIIQANLTESPLYTGIIESKGPRYCPSVEDKIHRFADKDRHQVFLEREGRQTQEVYVGGLSTSLPYSVQLEFLRTIKGLEKVEIIRPGYAIEYDYIDSTQLKSNLEVKDLEGLFFAGQVNGTSGYEEAAAQGLIAGINAACKVLGREAFILGRDEAYIGVLIDDLTMKGTKEPYRMLSSRAEWRLLLREDNVVERLYQKAQKYDLLSDEDQRTLETKLKSLESLRELSQKIRFKPSDDLHQKIGEFGIPPLKSGISLAELLKRPEASLELLKSLLPKEFKLHAKDEWLQLLTDIKYEGYLRQAKSQIQQMKRLESWRIPSDLVYEQIPGLAREAIEKLNEVRPETLGQASRIDGVNPSSISVLAIYLSRRNNLACANG